MGHIVTRQVRFDANFGVQALAARGRTAWDLSGNVLSAPPPPPPPTGTWLSGFSGDYGFAAIRGTPCQVRGDWNDATVAGQQNLWAIAPGGPEDATKWTGPMDLACGGIFKVANGAPTNETWALAAQGAYDTRWRACLTNAKNHWGSRNPADLHLRFAHEFNGEWYPWYVDAATAPAFVAGWRHFHALKQEIFPGCKLTWCPATGRADTYDIRTAFPGAAYCDVIGPDHYNWWPAVTTQSEFDADINLKRSDGGPIGIEAIRQFAESVGLPIAIPEWGNYGKPSAGGGGDYPQFMSYMHTWFTAHSGTGAGRLKYEIYFNVQNFGVGQYELWPTTAQPNARDRYIALF